MNRHDILGATLTVVTLAFLSSMGALAYYMSAPEAHDPDSLCPTDRAVPHTVMLVDRTDPLTEEHGRLLLETTERAIASLKLHERFSLFLIEGQAPAAPTPVFSVCKPADGTDANWLYENKRLIRASYEERFGEPLSVSVRKLTEPAQAPTSPIMETIRNIAAVTEFAVAAGERTLIVVSDLLQNMPAYSHYRTNPDYERFRSSAYAASVRPDLAGVAVELVYLRNRKTQRRQGRAHLGFWEAYFADGGAAPVEVMPAQDHRTPQGSMPWTQ